MNKIIRTPKVIGNYVHVGKSRINDLNGKEEYSLQILWDKIDMASFTDEVNAMVLSLAKDCWGANIPPMRKHPIRDADEEGKKEEHYRGKLFMNLRTEEAPGIVDASGAPIDGSQCRSGDYFRVSMAGFAYKKPPPGGVTFFLNNLQWIGKGKSISGRMRPEEEFGPIEDTDTLPAGMME